MRNAESRRREFLSHVRSKHQSGSPGFIGPVGAVARGRDRWRRSPTQARQGTVAGPCVQEPFYGNRFFDNRHRPLKIADRDGVVVLDVDTGVFDDGYRRFAVHSTERKAKANSTFCSAGCTHISRTNPNSRRTPATGSECDRRNYTPSRSRGADTSFGSQRAQIIKSIFSHKEAQKNRKKLPKYLCFLFVLLCASLWLNILLRQSWIHE